MNTPRAASAASLLATGLGLLAIAPAPARGGEAEVARFLREYPQAGARLRDAYSRIRGSYRLARQSHLPPGNTTVEVGTVTFACDHGSEKVIDETTSQESGQVEVIRLCDGKRESVLLRPAGGSGECFLQGTVEVGQALGISCRKRLDPFLAAPFAVEGFPLADLIREPSFRLKSATPIEVDGRRCLEVDYEIGQVKTEVTVALDPAASWAIRRAEIRQGSAPNTRFTYAISYEPGSVGEEDAAGASPRMVAVVHDAPFNSYDRCEFLALDFEGTPAEEFTLAHHGLSDSSPARGLPTRWESIRPWLDRAVALGAIAAVALALKRRMPFR